MKVEDLELISSVLKQKSGIVVGVEKAYLYESRLLPLIRKWNLQSFEDIVALVKKNNQPVIDDIVQVMTTNETSFFRDKGPFETLEKDVLPALIKARAAEKKIRIWSAAASSGQECYTISMILDRLGIQKAGWTVEVLGTDICEKALNKAKLGEYTQFEIQRGISVQHLVKNFTNHNGKWQVKDHLKKIVHFEKANLIQPFDRFGKFDIVLCRNVLIYFDVETKADILKRIYTMMPQDGHLILGGGETVMGITKAFRVNPDHRGFYLKSDALNAKEAVA